MIGIGIVSAALVFAAIPVKGGSPSQRDSVRSAVESVPACLRSCDGGLPIRISNQPPKWWEEGWDFPELKGTPNAFHVKHPNGKHDEILVSPTLASNSPKAERAYAKNFCGTNEEMKAYLSNLDSWMLHEHAHHYQASCKHGEKVVKKFLKLRYNKLIRKLQKDKGWKSLNASYREIWENPKLSMKEKRAKACALTERRAKLTKKHDLPSRHAGDAHCVDNDGKEYFAIAIQTLVHDPEEFCRAFSKEEQDFLRDTFGECFSGESTAPCFGTHAEQHGGQFLEP